jgi:hypothetical protein
MIIFDLLFFLSLFSKNLFNTVSGDVEYRLCLHRVGNDFAFGIEVEEPME